MAKYDVRIVKKWMTHMEIEAETKEELKLKIANICSSLMSTLAVTENEDGTANIGDEIEDPLPDFKWIPWGGGEIDNVYEIEGKGGNNMTDEVKEFFDKWKKRELRQQLFNK